MIKIIVKTTTTKKDTTVDLSSTPLSVFQEFGIGLQGSVANLNGAPLTTSELNLSFDKLGVTDGSTVYLNSVVKADGGR